MFSNTSHPPHISVSAEPDQAENTTSVTSDLFSKSEAFYDNRQHAFSLAVRSFDPAP
jgi:hypothetical protein